MATWSTVFELVHHLWIHLQKAILASEHGCKQFQQSKQPAEKCKYWSGLSSSGCNGLGLDKEKEREEERKKSVSPLDFQEQQRGSLARCFGYLFCSIQREEVLTNSEMPEPPLRCVRCAFISGMLWARTWKNSSGKVYWGMAYKERGRNGEGKRKE
ncbi:hypothetical protein VTN96DRAFT_10351 [Rasamsonia emersonii]